jgi:hypothetical protein
MGRCPRLLLPIILMLAVLGGLLPRGASAQPLESQTFGTATETVQVLAAARFEEAVAGSNWSYVANVDPITGILARDTSGPTLWLAGLRLPAGAVVTRLEVAACDVNAAAQLTFQLFRSRVPPGTGFEPVTPLGATGATPGCGLFSVTPSGPLVIDNANATYWVHVTTDAGTAFDSARVYYQLQVSAAPGTATFGDVPTTHPFFQFVEALVASGITAGCGGGNYCPDASLTRGQMAAFLAKGLGLHFAP